MLQLEGSTRSALSMWVPGKPQTAGSKSAFVNPKTGKAIVTESAKGAAKVAKKTWRQDLRDEGVRQRRTAWLIDEPVDGPLAVHFVFVRSRPSSQMRSGRHAGAVKDSARWRRPIERPDALKLARAAEDALTGVLWLDDSQIVREVIEKAYGDDVGLDPRAEGMLVVVVEAGDYRGPLVRSDFHARQDSPESPRVERGQTESGFQP
jgi:Holliday junction resolvase RusA-like endonuclease